MIAAQPLNVNAIAEKFDVSRQAISLHVRILHECGLIAVTRQGRERYCAATLDALGEVSAWIAQYRQHWEKRFDKLEDYLDNLQKSKQHVQRKK
ncbi:hypothetical protein GCM10023143_00970 [Compostibacter hankyongensis]|uniref:HTH arsR-type domain-containing protein n=2 Tax=Compostibacter hankyongensis TaxID=1007089 RepID=A0ABP8FC32_9BACT